MNNILEKIIRALSAMPPVAKKSFEENLSDSGLILCRMTGKAFPVTDLTVINTGPIKCVNRISKEALASIPKDFCPIACVGCKEIIAWISPGTNNRGFTLKPRKAYHVLDCPDCNPEKFKGLTVESRLIEEIYWSKEHSRTIVNFSKP
jgi:RNase P subunit RPR2